MGRILITVGPLPSMSRRVVWFLLFWGMLVGAIGVSKAWFAGSWVVDLIALFFALMAVVAFGMRSGGTSVWLTRPQLRLWVDAGMPDDVKAWEKR